MHHIARTWPSKLGPDTDQTGVLAAEFAGLRFQPYAPIRVQFLNIWRAVNRARHAAGYERVPIECVPWRRRIVRPFGETPVGEQEAA